MSCFTSLQFTNRQATLVVMFKISKHEENILMAYIQPFNQRHRFLFLFIGHLYKNTKQNKFKYPERQSVPVSLLRSYGTCLCLGLVNDDHTFLSCHDSEICFFFLPSGKLVKDSAVLLKSHCHFKWSVILKRNVISVFLNPITHSLLNMAAMSLFRRNKIYK